MSIIKSYCKILPGSVCLNGKTFFEGLHKPFIMNDFFSTIYERMEIDYRKFFKMDALSKLGFLAAELLLKGADRAEPKQDMGIILFNRSSSLGADMNYRKTIQDKENFYPSPAEFVYTLPNIVTGEIAIRHKIYGETNFFVLPRFYGDVISEIIDNTLHYGRLKCALAGWVEVDAFTNTLNCMMILCATNLSCLPAGQDNIYSLEPLLLNDSNLIDLYNY